MVKNKTKSLSKRKIFIFFVLSGLLIFAAYRFVQHGLHPVDESYEELVEIEVPSGSSKTQIGTILKENKLINSITVYNIYARLTTENNFKAGHYYLSPSMSLEEIVDDLNKGGSPVKKTELVRLVIPEGINIEQIADRFEMHTDFSSEEVIKFIQQPQFIQQMVAEYPELLTDSFEVAADTRYVLEGYLFPATYDIYKDTSLEEIMIEMISLMNQAISPYYQEIQSMELNVHEILTLASYIEGEGVSDKDRKLISGVFYNRLATGMRLRTDPSVSYALGEHRERITYKDLEVDSPYNTYMYDGIGAGPINSPSESAIQASLYPTETDYLFFLADLNTGNIYFAETYEEHLEYKRKYLDNN